MRLQFFSLIIPELKELLKVRDFKAVAATVKEADPVDVADGWGSLSTEEQEIIFRLLPRRLQMQLFEELTLEEQKILVASLQKEDAAADAAAAEAAQDPSAPPSVRRLHPRLMNQFNEIMKRESEQTDLAQTWPPETTGSHMRTRFITVRAHWTTHHALEHIRANTRLRHADDLYLDTIYVTNDDGHLLGYVLLKDLIVSPRQMGVRSLMIQQAHALKPETDQEEAANLLRKYKLESAPVVDGEYKPIGILLFKDMIRVIQQETEEDFAKMAGTRAGLLSGSVWQIARVRFPWLIATCLGYFVVGWVVKQHELTLAKVIGLASFMPLIAAMGGNVGAQTATAVVRGLATGEVKALGALEVVLKEIAVGLLLGSLYGLGAAGAAHLIYGAQFGWHFALVVGSGMFASMSAAALMGSLEPFIFERIKIDPATATGPLITFFADFTSTSVYLTIAAWLFSKF